MNYRLYVRLHADSTTKLEIGDIDDPQNAIEIAAERWRLCDAKSGLVRMYRDREREPWLVINGAAD